MAYVESEELEKKDDTKEKRSGMMARFVCAFLITCVLAVLLLILWSWISYHMRFSTDVIRVGLMAVYILSCFAGGKMLCRGKCRRPWLWGSGLGAGFFALVLLLACLMNMDALQGKSINWFTLLLCVLSAALGGKKTFSY